MRIVPSIDEVLRFEEMASAERQFGRVETVLAVRSATALLRDVVQTPLEGEPPDNRTDAVNFILNAAMQTLKRRHMPALRKVLNLTGTVLHTNLGRAIYATSAVDAAVSAMESPVALEFDLDTGKRGDRDSALRDLICAQTGAESACIVNNNAAAVLLVLASLAQNRETIVSRGELIEIGGSFRIPSIMESAGTQLVEVGTTNRTHLHDYENAIRAETALIMKVHTSNYRVCGFTKEISTRELAELGQKRGVPVVEDMGSGTLVDLSEIGLKRERTVSDAISEGADLVTFSGDKLLGGPQAGLIVGRHDFVQACAKHPMKRALRLDKARLAALDATIKEYRNPTSLDQNVPTMALLRRSLDELRVVAESVRPALEQALDGYAKVTLVETESQIGSGAQPLETISSVGVRIFPHQGQDGKNVEELAALFRKLPVPVIGRISKGALVFDLRCLLDPENLTGQLTALDLRSGEGGHRR